LNLLFNILPPRFLYSLNQVFNLRTCDHLRAVLWRSAFHPE